MASGGKFGFIYLARLLGKVRVKLGLLAFKANGLTNSNRRFTYDQGASTEESSSDSKVEVASGRPVRTNSGVRPFELDVQTYTIENPHLQI